MYIISIFPQMFKLNCILSLSLSLSYMLFKLKCSMDLAQIPHIQMNAAINNLLLSRTTETGGVVEAHPSIQIQGLFVKYAINLSI